MRYMIVWYDADYPVQTTDDPSEFEELATNGLLIIVDCKEKTYFNGEYKLPESV